MAERITTDLSIVRRRPPFGWPTLIPFGVALFGLATAFRAINLYRVFQTLVALNAVPEALKSQDKARGAAMLQPGWFDVLRAYPAETLIFSAVIVWFTIVAIGLLLERHWGRVGIAIGSAVLLLVVAPAAKLGWVNPGKLVSWQFLAMHAFMLFFMVPLTRFRHEPEAGYRDLKRMPKLAWGWLRLRFEDLRRIAGFSAFPRNTGAILMSGGGELGMGEFASYFDDIHYGDGVWLEVGRIQMTGVPVRLPDLELLRGGDEDSVVEIAVAPGNYVLSIQLVRLVGEASLRAMRVRMVKSNAVIHTLVTVSGVGVDHGAMALEFSTGVEFGEEEPGVFGTVADRAGGLGGLWWRTPFGDGSFDVVELQDVHEKVIGWAVEMLPGPSRIMAFRRDGWLTKRFARDEQ